MQKKMKQYKVHYTVESRRDLDEVWDYIAADLQNVSAATHTVNEIMDAVDQLAQFAETGTPLSSIANIESEYRFLVCKKYMVFYRIDGADVYIDRILYGRRDYLRVLLGDAAPTGEIE